MKGDEKNDEKIILDIDFLEKLALINGEFNKFIIFIYKQDLETLKKYVEIFTDKEKVKELPKELLEYVNKIPYPLLFFFGVILVTIYLKSGGKLYIPGEGEKSVKDLKEVRKEIPEIKEAIKEYNEKILKKIESRKKNKSGQYSTKIIQHEETTYKDYPFKYKPLSKDEKLKLVEFIRAMVDTYADEVWNEFYYYYGVDPREINEYSDDELFFKLAWALQSEFYDNKTGIAKRWIDKYIKLLTGGYKSL